MLSTKVKLSYQFSDVLSTPIFSLLVQIHHWMIVIEKSLNLIRGAKRR
jgi:hypothetical protein